MALVIPSSARPSNLHLRPDQLRYELDGDTLLWLENLPREVEDGECLNVQIQPEHARPFIVTEIVRTEDGDEEQFVMRTDHLGADTYLALRRMKQVPLYKRVEEGDKIAAAWKKEHAELEQARLYEEVGGPMRHQLKKDGFVDSIGYVKPPTGKGA